MRIASIASLLKWEECMTTEIMCGRMESLSTQGASWAALGYPRGPCDVKSFNSSAAKHSVPTKFGKDGQIPPGCRGILLSIPDVDLSGEQGTFSWQILRSGNGCRGTFADKASSKIFVAETQTEGGKGQPSSCNPWGWILEAVSFHYTNHISCQAVSISHCLTCLLQMA